MIPYPEDDYLLLLGKLVYAVGYLEWLPLGDLSGLDVPPALKLTALEGQTTSDIGKRLTDPDLLAGVADSAARGWLEEAGRDLLEVAPKRNAVLHARPATHPKEDQRLHRRDPKTQETYWITNVYLDQLLADIYERLRRLNERRPPQS